MGVLSNVLNVLSGEVGADGTNVQTNTSRHRKRTRVEDEEEKLERKAFRTAVGDSLSALAVTNQMIAAVNRTRAVNESIASRISARAVEEDKLVKFQVNAMEASSEQIKTFCEDLAHVHAERIQDLTDEIMALKRQSAPELSNAAGEL